MALLNSKRTVKYQKTVDGWKWNTGTAGVDAYWGYLMRNPVAYEGSGWIATCGTGRGYGQTREHAVREAIKNRT